MDRGGKKTHAVRYLPEHLVENIVARIPFPSILKARQLSKEWKLKFPSVARQNCLSWPHYLARSTGSEVVIYDPVDCVKRMPVSIGFYPKDACGSLLVAVKWHQWREKNRRLIRLEATVMNALTRQSKTIICPMTARVEILETLLLPVGTDHYNLIIWYSRRGSMDVTVYHSNSGSWKTHPHWVSSYARMPVYKDGSLYYIRSQVAVDGFSFDFVRLNIESGAQTETPLPVQDTLLFVFDFLVRCGSDIVAVVMYSRSLIVLQLDTESSTLVEVSRTPVRTKDFHIFYDRFRRVFCRGSSNRVFLSSFSGIGGPNDLYVYDMNAKTWSSNRVPTEFPTEFLMDKKGRAALDPPYVLEFGFNPFVAP